ncbi:Gfo/Idh/MocA family protein [Paenibacillus sp. KN14-4R]|uniref:Gfo/Idh/MocA family protein n=1 Tax=Paenibacillus sp. KN14-4R TaxID=3445773 RepID=UPI003FA0401E
MTMIHIGVIGCGSISEVHFQAYEHDPRATIYAVCDLNEERAASKAKQFGAEKVYTNYLELLADPTIEAVSICTWNNTHAEIAIAALEAGKHVLCEKPLCKTVEEALRVEEAVRRSGKVLQVGFVRRFATNTDLLKGFIDSGDLGEIYYAKASILRRLGNPGGWFADHSRSGGGPLIDIGVHIIDVCWYLMGKPKIKSISGNVYNRLGNRSNVKNLSFYKAADYAADQNTVEDCANALLRFENGASLMVDVSFTLHAKKDELSVKLFGTKGGAELEPELSLVTEKLDTILNIQPQIDHLSFDFVHAFRSEISAFISCCFGEQETLAPVEDGVELMKMLCGIYEAAEKGHEITFE